MLKEQKGFTLVELMVVIMIIGLLIAIVIPDLLKTREQSEVEACKASLRGVQSALELYYTHYKYYPSKLDSLITEGYLSEKGDEDPWGRKLRYQPKYSGEGSEEGGGGSGSSQNAGNYYMGSDGPDGKKGTEDDIDPPINPNRHSFKNAGNEAAGAGGGDTTTPTPSGN